MVPPDLILSLSQQFTKIPNFCSFFLTQTDISSLQLCLWKWKVSLSQDSWCPGWPPRHKPEGLLPEPTCSLTQPTKYTFLQFTSFGWLCHFLKEKFKNCEQLAWYQAFTSSFCNNSGKQNLVCDSVYVVPVNGTFSSNCMQITEHIRVS